MRTSPTPIGLRDEGVAQAHTSLDWSMSTSKRLRVVEPCALAFENPYAGDMYVLELEHDHDGTVPVEWPPALIWNTTNRQPPVLTSRRAARDILVFYWDGGSYIGTEYARGIPVARTI